jgi:hypothetical protein
MRENDLIGLWETIDFRFVVEVFGKDFFLRFIAYEFQLSILHVDVPEPRLFFFAQQR